MKIEQEVEKLLNYWLKKEVIKDEDLVYTRNSIYSLLKITDINLPNISEESHANAIAKIVDYAFKQGIINELDQDLLSSEIGNIVLGKPSEIYKTFKDVEKSISRKAAFDWFFDLSKDSYYVKYDQIAKNLEWETKENFGNLQVTINLSKPPKTQAEIIAAAKAKPQKYPKCVICYENVGYSGNAKTKPRRNLRFIPLNLDGYNMFLQYSPYGYFNHHLILNEYTHEDMKIDKSTFVKLISFVEQNKFYFVGSNSDIPIVGGSILSHNHYQGGAASFPIFNSKPIDSFNIENIKVEILDWPLSTIKLVSDNKDELIELSNIIFEKWKQYENKELNIFKEKDGERQNSVTPVVRWHENNFEVYIILRNNGTNKEFPQGIFHFHEEIWNIKSENIGLIEAIGRAILPNYLLNEIGELSQHLDNKTTILPENLKKHQNWYDEIKQNYDGINSLEFIKEEVGHIFAKGLYQCGVFKKDSYEEFKLFARSIV